MLPSALTWPENLPHATVEDDGQIRLFAPRAVLARELDLALAAGRFEEAASVRWLIEATYGSCPETRELDVLDRLQCAPWREPARALAAWEPVDSLLEKNASLRARIRDGVFARLLQSHAPETLMEARPACLAGLTAALLRIAGEDGPRRARRLVREALLDGRELEPLDFRHDAPVADLLAEDLAPRWLACLGAIRRLWPARAADSGDLAPFSGEEAPGVSDDDAAAREFWRCLCAAGDPSAGAERRQEARRRMKRLQTDLHREYMNRVSGAHA